MLKMSRLCGWRILRLGANMVEIVFIPAMSKLP